MTQPRPEGFYWVRYHGELMVSHHVDGDWYLTDCDVSFDDSAFDAIGEIIPPPEDL